MKHWTSIAFGSCEPQVKPHLRGKSTCSFCGVVVINGRLTTNFYITQMGRKISSFLFHCRILCNEREHAVCVSWPGAVNWCSSLLGRLADVTSGEYDGWCINGMTINSRPQLTTVCTCVCLSEHTEQLMDEAHLFETENMANCMLNTHT